MEYICPLYFKLHILDWFTFIVESRVRRLDVPTKPDTFRFIDDINIFLISYPNILDIEIVSTFPILYVSNNHI
jgi:hypothetical protein